MCMPKSHIKNPPHKIARFTTKDITIQDTMKFFIASCLTLGVSAFQPLAWNGRNTALAASRRPGDDLPPPPVSFH